jgi:hypothetical protein
LDRQSGTKVDQLGLRIILESRIDEFHVDEDLVVLEMLTGKKMSPGPDGDVFSKRRGIFDCCSDLGCGTRMDYLMRITVWVTFIEEATTGFFVGFAASFENGGGIHDAPSLKGLGFYISMPRTAMRGDVRAQG